MNPKPNRPYSLASIFNRGVLFIALAILSTAFVGCGFEDEQPFSALDLDSVDESVDLRIQELSNFCTVQVKGHGAVDVENDYIPNSIACENGNAPLEALKLQAIAARTYAKFVTEAERRPLEPSTRDQMYKCSYASPKAIHFQAARETAGQVFTHNNKLIASFYVAGSLRSGATCSAGSDPTKTEKWVTYNQGRTGAAVQGTRLGSLSNPANRGAMSQNGSACWAKNGWKHDRIARYYYGDDIKITQLSTCGAGTPNPTPGGGDACSISSASTSTSAPSCTSGGQAPNILPRSAWGAKAPRGYYGKHTPNRITIHHSVTSNTATDSAAQARAIQQMHFNNGWNDVGYHFLVGRDGKIYRGSEESRLGTHVLNQNTGNLGIVLIGTYHENTAPTDAQLKATAQLVGYLGKKYKITLNRTNVKGHGERMATLCPGKQVLNRFDKILEWAKADSVCTNPGQTPSNPNGTGEYRYVRVVTTNASPTASNDTIDGFEVDAIHVERSASGKTENIYAKAVMCSPGVSNPGAGIGQPDNTTCDNRKSTVAGVPVGATYVVELAKPLKDKDVLYITQHLYRGALNDCGPSGTARISISEDGKVWKSVNKSVQGNSSIVITDAHFKAQPEEEPGGSSTFTFTAPKAGQWYTPNMVFTVHAGDPKIVRVKYYAEDNWPLGESTNRSTGFRVTYPYQYYGQRNSIAIGYDANGNEVARTSVGFTVTSKDGSIPGGKTDPGPPPTGVPNTELANKLKTEGGKCWDGVNKPRCSNGRGGSSIGYCWRYVARALTRAGVNYSKLAGAGPCSAAQFNASAYAFGCNASANPAILSTLGLKKINVAPKDAPAGAIITYGKSCLGAHAVHGHIEISMGDGYACSDYCGRIRSGNPSCAAVFAPIK